MRERFRDNSGGSNAGLIIGVAVAIVVVLGIVATMMLLSVKTTSVVITVPAGGKATTPSAQVQDDYDGFGLVPGTYKMNWEMHNSSVNERVECSAYPLEPELRKKFAWPIAKTAYHSCCEGLDIVVEKNGKAFDTAYVIPTFFLHSAGKAARTHGWRVPLAKASGDWTNDHFRLKLRVGSGSHVMEKDVELSVRATEAGSGGVSKIEEIGYDWRGGWFGLVQTSNGLYRMRLIDQDKNGIYSDRPGYKYLCDVCKQYHDSAVDIVNVKGIPAASGLSQYCTEDQWPVSGIGMVAGKLYVFDTPPTGESVTIKRYTGPAGNVKVVASDGFGKPAAFSVSFSTGGGFAISGCGSRVIKLPPGTYSVGSFVQYLDHAPSFDHELQGKYELQCSAPEFRVIPGVSATVRLGGPMEFEITPAHRPISVKSGSKALIKVRLKSPRAFSGWPGDYRKPNVEIRIKDAGGAVVRKLDVNVFAKVEASATNVKDQTLAKFNLGSLPPGEYQVVVRHERSEAFGEASAGAKIVVTP